MKRAHGNAPNQRGGAYRQVTSPNLAPQREASARVTSRGKLPVWGELVTRRPHRGAARTDGTGVTAKYVPVRVTFPKQRLHVEKAFQIESGYYGCYKKNNVICHRNRHLFEMS